MNSHFQNTANKYTRLAKIKGRRAKSSLSDCLWGGPHYVCDDFTAQCAESLYDVVHPLDP